MHANFAKLRSPFSIVLILLFCAAAAGAQVAAHFSYTENFFGPASAGTSQGVAVDTNGNMYLALTGGGGPEIVRIPANDPTCLQNDCTTIGPQSGFGINLDVASFVPGQLATDESGDLFIANGSGVLEMLADVLDGSQPPSTCADDLTCKQIGTGANLNNAHGVAVDASGTVYIADTGNSRIVKIPSPDPLCTQGGCTAIPVSGAWSVAVDGVGNLYVAENAASSLIEEEVPQSGGVYAAIDVATGVANVVGIGVDNAGNIFAATGDVIFEFTPSYFGGTYAQRTVAALPVAQLTLDVGGNLYAAGGSSSQAGVELRLRVTDFGSVPVASTSQPLSLTFTFDVGGSIAAPRVLMQGASGLDFSDAGTGTCTTNGSHVYSAGDTCTVDVTFTPARPGTRAGVANLVDPSGNVIATAHLTGMGLGPQATFSPGALSVFIGGNNYGPYYRPYGLAIDHKGDVFVADSAPFESSVYELGSDGALIQRILGSGGILDPTASASGFDGPMGVALDNSGNLYIADTKLGLVEESILNSDGSYSRAEPWGTEFVFGNPTSVAVGDRGNVYVANRSDQVRVIPESNPDCQGDPQDGRYCGILKDPLINPNYNSSITGVAAPGGNVFIADAGFQQVVEIGPSALGFATANNIVYGGTLIADGLGGSPDFRVAVGGDGVFIYDTVSRRVIEVFRPGGQQAVVLDASDGIQLQYGGDIALDDNGDLFVSGEQEGGTPSVFKLDRRTCRTSSLRPRACLNTARTRSPSPTRAMSRSASRHRRPAKTPVSRVHLPLTVRVPAPSLPPVRTPGGRSRPEPPAPWW